MPKRKIVITLNDYEYLKELLSSEFTQAISPSDFLESLEAELELAEVVDPERVPKNVVTMNSTVKLRDLDTNELETYTLVFPEDADIANYKLSVLAPVGTAILGQRVGDVLRWRVPDGWRRLRVVAPKLLFSRAYCSLPTRRYCVSSRRTTAARTASRHSERLRRSAATFFRSFGSAAPNSSVPVYFFLSRRARKAS